MRSRHYNSSVPFEWIRAKIFKVDKPYALGLDEWDDWYAELKKDKPFAYWCTEKLPRLLEKPSEWLFDPIRNAKVYLCNRYIDRTHYLHTGLPPGQWHEFDTRIIHGLFTELVNFVEIESAWMHVGYSEEDRKKYKIPFWRNNWWIRFKRWRCPRAGIDHLNWAMRLDDDEVTDIFEPNSQAKAARETMILYTWWKEIRPARVEPYELLGISDFHAKLKEKYGVKYLGLRAKLTPSEQLEYDRLHLASDELDNARAREDEAMMIRLIKMRSTMWT